MRTFSTPFLYWCQICTPRASDSSQNKKESLTDTYEYLSGFSHRLLVEAGRVELPSEKGPRKASTGLVCVRVFASGDARRRASVSYPSVSSSPASRMEKMRTSPMGLTPRRRIRLQPLRRDDRGRQGALLLRQRRRSRNRCWQLL